MIIGLTRDGLKGRLLLIVVHLAGVLDALIFFASLSFLISDFMLKAEGFYLDKAEKNYLDKESEGEKNKL
jgi:hypothetical protein